MQLSSYLVWNALCLLTSAAGRDEQTVLAPTNAADDVQEELKSADIIPSVIDDFKPTFGLNASWSSDDYASLGNTLKPKRLQDAPSVSLLDLSSSKSACKSGVTFTITLTDPDAPSRDNPKWSEMCHWIATGVSVSDASDASGRGCSDVLHLASLEDVMPYKAPGPPSGTGKHRYVFLVFAPSNGTTDRLDLTKPDDRQHWGTGKKGHGVRDWAHDNGLEPVAANFVYAAHD